MRNVVCPQCNETVHVPDDLARAHCVRCGQVIVLTEANITAHPAPASPQAIQPEAAIDIKLSDAPSDPIRLGSWTSWEEFRSQSPAVQRELMHLATRPLPDLRSMRTFRLPEDAPEEIDEWGKALGTINIPGDRPMAHRIVCSLFLGGGLMLLVIGAILFVFTPRNQGRPDPVPGMMLVFYGGLGIVVGALLWYIRTPKLPKTVWVFEEGLFLRSYGRSRVARWDEIQDFETSTDTGRPLFWLTVTHDLSVTISVGFAPDVIPLMEYIEIRLAASQFLRRLESIWAGRQQRFGAVSLDREGFQGPDFFVPWREVGRVVSDSHHLFVARRRDDDSASIRYRDVSFPYLVMAIAHVLMEEHSRLAPLDA